jgi:hypothetical protein
MDVGIQNRLRSLLRPTAADRRLLTALCLLLAAYCFLPAVYLFAQEQTPATEAVQPPEDEKPLPGDWAVELIDAAEHSPNSEARDALYRAAMATGPAIVPQLEEALKDDRTAEFAAQALAFIGGEKAIQILWKLQEDTRDLGLRRFYYGALAEFDAPEAAQALLAVVNRSDQEPDRTVTEAAVIALTVRSDPKLVAPLREALAKTQDVVIRLDLENALEVIEARAKYLAAPQAKKTGASIEDAVRTYFAPALNSPEASPLSSPPAGPKSAAGHGSAAAASKPAATKTSAAKSPAAPEPPIKVRIQQLTFSPDKTRALARVTFEDPSAVANYDMVLQKRYGEWFVASVWLGTETEKAPPIPAPPENSAD